jgi:hypothetical protein
MAGFLWLSAGQYVIQIGSAAFPPVLRHEAELQFTTLSLSAKLFAVPIVWPIARSYTFLSLGKLKDFEHGHMTGCKT